MKNIIISILLLASITSYANLEVYFMYSTFNTEQKPYVETYLSVIGETAKFVKTDGEKYCAEIEITMIFKKADSIVAIDKYNLKSPQIQDTSALKPNFVDVQRISLPNGIYNFEMIIKDINNGNKEQKYTDIIQIDYSATKLQFSGIELLEKISPTTKETSLSKNGFDLFPYISNFYPSNSDKISFYSEIYNSDKAINDNFIVRYYIENFETKKEIETCSRFKKLSSDKIIPLVGEINIADIPSGNYNLVLEIKNANNEMLLNTKFFFQRSKPSLDNNVTTAEIIKKNNISNTFQGSMHNKDSLQEYLSCLRPLADLNEKNFIDNQLKVSSIEILQNYFIEFWLKRSNSDPGGLWKIYKEQVDFVDKHYRTPINRGYETDRGRVYLQYGAPNSIYVSKHEPSSYPYEIWHYYRVANENNKKFIFYNPNIAGKEFELLHSDLTGEVKTPNWERVLSKRNNALYNHDVLNSDDSWGSRAKDEYDR